MEIETAARKFLLSKASITNLTGQRVWKFDRREPLEGTGKAGLVVRRRGGWSSPGFGSQEFPSLVVDCLSDHSRHQNGQPIQFDREERAMQLFREVDRILHQREGEVKTWPENDPFGMVVLGCLRGTEPGEPVELDGVAMVRVVYDVKTFH